MEAFAACHVCGTPIAGKHAAWVISPTFIGLNGLVMVWVAVGLALEPQVMGAGFTLLFGAGALRWDRRRIGVLERQETDGGEGR